MEGLKKRFTGLVAFVATLAMVLGMVTPAFAAGYTITITNTEADHTYNAYQIFSGDVYTDTTSNNTYLSNVNWADGVSSQTLLETLSKDNATVQVSGQSSTIASLFAGKNTASDVAEVLNDNLDNAALATHFADAAATAVTNKVAGTSSRKTDNTGYTLPLTSAGYYLVVDTAGTGSASTSRHILKVLNANETFATKSSTPTVVKKVQENNTGNTAATGTGDNNYGTRFNDTADFSIGDAVPFKLIGTIPENMTDYSYYKYIFHDTLSESLTAPQADGIHVYLSYEKSVNFDNPDAAYTDGQGTSYSLAQLEAADSTHPVKDVTALFTRTVEGQNITVAPNNANYDLKIIDDINATFGDGDTAQSSYRYVIVTYSATLNNKAAIGRQTIGTSADGNVNKVKIEYSNNPNKETETKSTPDDKVIVFTYDVDINKYNANKTQQLSGAEFKLYRGEGNNKQYAIVDNGKLAGWGTDAQATTLTSQANQAISIAGLDAGTYYIEETKAPDGYNKASEGWTITVTADTSNGQDKSSPTPALLTKLTSTISGNNAESGDTTAMAESGVVTTNLRNTQGFQLPTTGGMGTMALTIAGIAIVACAGIILTIRKRANDEQ